MNRLQSSITRHYQHNSDILLSCQQALQEQYPRLTFRWARIYGRRWSYILGNAANKTGLASVRMQLNDNYGLFIENPGTIPLAELELITGILKEFFQNDDYITN